MPVLSHVHLRAEATPEGGRLIVSAYNLDWGMVVTIPGKVEKEGAVVVPAKLLASAVAKSPEAVVGLTAAKNNRLSLASGTWKTEIVGIHQTEFPDMPPVPKDHTFAMTCPALLNLVKFVETAMSEAVDRQHLNGACFSVKDGTLSVRALNGAEVAWCSLPVKGAPDVADSIVARETLSSLSKALGTDDGEIAICLTENALTMKTGALTIVSRLVSGSFPDVLGIVGDECPINFDLPRARIVEALNRASVIAENMVRLDVAKDGLTISGTDADHGTTSEAVVILSEGTGKIFARPKFLTNALAVYSCETIRMAICDQFIRVTDPSDPTRIRVAAPMRGE